MKKEYDIVYLTNTPSFYKLNLCQALAGRGVKLLLVLYGYGAEAVNTQLSDAGGWAFDYVFLHKGDSNKRNKLKTFVNLLRLMRRIKTRRVLFAGWLAPEYNLYSFISPRKKNVVISESRGEDVALRGIAGFLKKSIIRRMGAALPSGLPHKMLFDNLKFKGKIEMTGSVGILNKRARKLNHIKDNPLRFLYVGRLTEVKNLKFLIKVFNKLGLPLTIAGKGEQKEELESMAKDNIKFLGFINNTSLRDVYQQNDVFILPSSYEPWGLVVEEALYWGLPVIVSDKVGSGQDMVCAYGTGLIFRHDDEQSLCKSIDEITLHYDEYLKNVNAIDWQQREDQQVDAYMRILK